MYNKLLTEAYAFATHVHRGQVRKYTGLPYMTHCAAVAKLVAKYNHPDTVVAAALMHDCIEDAANPERVLAVMKDMFPSAVVELVLEVTDVSKPTDGNRAHRKELDRQHLAKASMEGQTIKLADLIDNTQDIAKHDKDFAKVYIKEKKLLLPVLTRGDYRLYQQACQNVLQAEYEAA